MVISLGETRNNDRCLNIEDVFYTEAEKETTIDGKKQIASFLQEISRSEILDNSETELSIAIKVSRNRESKLYPLNDDLDRNLYRMQRMSAKDGVICRFVQTQLLSQDEMAIDYDAIAATQYEEMLKETLRLIEPTLEDIAAVNHNTSRYNRIRNSDRIFKVKLKKYPETIPIKAMGDGIFRILQIALKAINAKNGFLVIDEFENGLHHTVQYKVWCWLFKIAKDLDIQIFATTHSDDTIKSFAKAAIEYDDVEGVLFRMAHSIQKGHEGEIIAIEYNEAKLQTILDNDIEVR